MKVMRQVVNSFVESFHSDNFLDVFERLEAITQVF